MKQVQAKVLSNVQPMLGYHLIDIDASHIAQKAKPGQFVNVSCGSDLLLRRPLSIHRIKNSKQISLLFAVVGNGTKWLSQREKGENLDLIGPLGTGFSIQQQSRKLLLLAGGIGIAPLVFLAQSALGEGKMVKLLIGARTKNCLYPRKLLPEGIETFVTTEDGSEGRSGKLTDIIGEYVDWADQIYTCGPRAMYQTIAEQSGQWASPKPVQVSLEVRLGCGIGACYGCSIKTKNGMKKVCQDGPVFHLDEVIWEEVII